MGPGKPYRLTSLVLAITEQKFALRFLMIDEKAVWCINDDHD
jgi:hypothetical protein